MIKFIFVEVDVVAERWGEKRKGVRAEYFGACAKESCLGKKLAKGQTWKELNQLSNQISLG